MKLSTKIYLSSGLSSVIGTILSHTYIWTDNSNFMKSAVVFYINSIIILVVAAIMDEREQKEK